MKRNKRMDHHRSRLTGMLFLAFAVSLMAIPWSQGVVHAGGGATLRELLRSFLAPDLSPELIRIGLQAAWQTLSYALASISIAVVIGLGLGIPASGVTGGHGMIRKAARGFLGFLRAIHELVWAWLFVAAIGLSPLAAVMALAIPYGGALGRVYADLLEDSQGPVINALRTTGAGRIQLLAYGHLPRAFASMLSYTMYRLECAIRSSSVLSFVGLGGLGFQIQISLQDLNYQEVWTLLFFLIGLVVLVDRLSWILRKTGDGAPSKNMIRSSVILLAAGSIASWLSIFLLDGADLKALFTPGNLAYFSRFIRGLLGLDETVPAFLDPGLIREALILSWETLLMSIIAIGLAAFGMLSTLLFSVRTFPGLRPGWPGHWMSLTLYYLIRAWYVFTRSVPELLWAMIIVFLFKPGILPGAIALGLHNIGILGKLCAEVLEDMEEGPLLALASAGAGRIQLFFYGVIPLAMNRFLTYILYRWEVIIRTSIVVGFVGAGGLGQAFKLAMSYFHYSEITLYLICYVLLVYLADLVSDTARRYIHS